MSDLVYLDAAASTPIAPEALKATVEAMQQPGNASGVHAAGYEAAVRVETAREALSELMHVGRAGVIFVSSATEANNLGIRGLIREAGRSDVIAMATDHPSALATVQDLVFKHGRSHLLGVQNTGEVSLDQLEEVLSDRTALVTINAANNETGTIQPVAEIVELAHRAGALVHADASQLMAWGPDSSLDECDLITVSSQKMHGPQGAAALIVRPRARKFLRPLITGGGQELGLRSGSANVAAIAGFGAAAVLSLETGANSIESVELKRARLLGGLRANIENLVEHGEYATRRLPGILNVAVGLDWPESVESEALLARLPKLAASTGSACHAGAPGPSPVLLAMGVPAWEAARSIRLSLSRYTTDSDVDTAISELGRGYTELVHLLRGTKTEERCAL